MKNRSVRDFIIVMISLLLVSCGSKTDSAAENKAQFRVEQDKAAGTISIYRKGQNEPALVQNARPDFRPYLHPVMAPDGKGSLTEFSPGHHKHQTGVYWGLTRINGPEIPQATLDSLYKDNNWTELKKILGRSYFGNPGGDYWQRVSAEVVKAEGEIVKWQTVYNMLDEAGKPIMTETQVWSMQEENGKYLIDLIWSGEAREDIIIRKHDYGGLFIRMPWREGSQGKAVNTTRQVNADAEGKQSIWIDISMEIEGRDDFGHIAILDHDANAGYPHAWRVDGELGVGPARTREEDWHFKKGEAEVVKHRLVAYTGEYSDVEIRDIWLDYVDSQNIYWYGVLSNLGKKAAYEAEFVTPEEAAEIMTTLDGFSVNAWAGEPMITQPMAFCWDDRGRMWVAENRDYEARFTGYSNSGDSRILILEDTDRDGVADSRKVFAEGIPFPSAIAVGFEGLFLGAPPHLLFVPDRNNDDKADMDDIEIRLTGWGIRDRHEAINSFHWGPDGWLYGLEGFATPSKIRKPTAEDRLLKPGEPFPKLLEGSEQDIFTGSYWDKGDWKDMEGVDINGGVFRYHPTKDIFEVVAHGLSNPWGIDYDEKGQLFITACVIPHVFHILLGGYYHRQGGTHFNPYIYSDLRAIVDHRHRSPHGGARVYQSDAFPPEYHGQLFMANLMEHTVLSDILKPNGSSYIASHGADFLHANNEQWIGFSIEIGPEGAVYVLDWHDANLAGSEVVHKETGRIFRIAPEKTLAKDFEGRYGDLKKLSDLQLADLQTSKSDWHSRRARIILQSRAARGEISAEAKTRLAEIYRTDNNSNLRLRAMWALHITNSFDEAALIASLSDDNEHVRAWAIQFLCEDKNPSEAALTKFRDIAGNDPSPVARLHLATALLRLDNNARWDIIEKLVMHTADNDDHNIPKMLWFALEPLIAEDANRSLDIAKKSKISLITEYTARRAVDADSVELVVAQLGPANSARPLLLKGLHDALEGRVDIKAPTNWASVYAALQADENLMDLATAVAQRFGDVAASGKYLKLLRDKTASTEQRRSAINNLASRQVAELEAMIPELVDDPSVRIEALRAMAAYDNFDLGNQIIAKYNSFNAEEKMELIQAYASRQNYGWAVVGEISDGRIPKSDIPPYVARQYRRVVGNGFLEIYGPIDQLPGNKALQLAKYEDLLTDEAISEADPINGEKVFAAQCGTCHKMYGKGGIIGPDITGSNRGNLDYLLSNIIDPSGEVQDAYKMVVVTTMDGRTYAGNIVGENNRQLRLRVVGQEDEIVINKSSIQSQEVTSNSIMPDGLLSLLSEQEVLDLIAFLRTTESLTLGQSH